MHTYTYLFCRTELRRPLHTTIVAMPSYDVAIECCATVADFRDDFEQTMLTIQSHRHPDARALLQIWSCFGLMAEPKRGRSDSLSESEQCRSAAVLAQCQNDDNDETVVLTINVVMIF